ncbi:MAG TPA: DUF72 domain-containing protein [Bacteroidota bacterium]|nr:DUF72 domain-containing protein [Bacteroidota bacterium]
MQSERAVYRVGTGGWEHEVFDSCFYPQEGASPARKLNFFARYFQTVEVRATFWDDSLTARDAREWIGALRDAPGFLFNIKLHSTFTHRKSLPPDLTRTVRQILQELARHNRLGSLAVQFPYSFTNTGTNRHHVVRIAEVFTGFPLHVEFRHQSWNQEGLVSFLRDHSLGVVGADMPRIRQYMPFITAVSGDTAYLRLHGRNEKGWLLNGYDARYDYQYNTREIREITRRLRGLDGRCRAVTVICNNTTGGKSLPLAFQLMSALREGKPLEIPPRTLSAFPYLRSVAAPESDGTPLLDDDYRRAI